jgi:hypothetical protein
MLLEHSPESGVYSIPANSNDPEIRASLYDQGLTGFVILNADGAPGNGSQPHGLFDHP